MLSVFPTLLKDELLYSGFARYVDLRNLKDDRPNREILLGSPSAPIAYGLPTRLDYLTNIIPPGHTYTSDYLINHHTLFPFYSPFVPPVRALEIRALMKTDTLKSMSVKVGINATRTEKLGYLRYCPACILQERAQMGFSYWHRTHQLPQVTACSTHAVWLEESPVKIETTKKRFITAESAIVKRTEATRLNPYASLDHTVSNLAQDAEWLLNQPALELGPGLIIERYCILLSRMKLASPAGKPNFNRIRNALNETFEHDTLVYLEHQLGQSSSRDWLYRLFIIGRAGLFQSPVSHLLFMRFLGIEPSSFFSDSFDLPLFFFAQNKE